MAAIVNKGCWKRPVNNGIHAVCCMFTRPVNGGTHLFSGVYCEGKLRVIWLQNTGPYTVRFLKGEHDVFSHDWWSATTHTFIIVLWLGHSSYVAQHAHPNSKTHQILSPLPDPQQTWKTRTCLSHRAFPRALDLAIDVCKPFSSCPNCYSRWPQLKKFSSQLHPLTSKPAWQRLHHTWVPIPVKPGNTS